MPPAPTAREYRKDVKAKDTMVRRMGEVYSEAMFCSRPSEGTASNDEPFSPAMAVAYGGWRYGGGWSVMNVQKCWIRR